MSDQQQRQEADRPRGVEALKQHMIVHKIDSVLWASRVLTVIFTIGYVIPIFWAPHNAYNKVLIANAITSSLRLYQRLPPFTPSKAYLQQMLLEDSFHYLLYSLIFLSSQPVLLIILPVMLFAFLHSASYSLTLLDTLGQNAWWGARLLISLVEFQARNILRLVAFVEIFVMPLTIVLVLSGKAGFITPLAYYKFLELRYLSRRNPCTRTMFHDLRLATENFANHAKTPAPIRQVLHGGVRFICRLAPPIQAQQQ